MDQVSSITDKSSHVKLKFTLVRFLRYQMLFPGVPGQKLAQSAIKYLLKDCKQHIKVAVEDYNQVYQYLLAT